MGAGAAREDLVGEKIASVGLSMAAYLLDSNFTRPPAGPVRLHVACRPGQEKLRDQAVILALCRALWTAEAARPRPEDGLTPQQRQVYRLLLEKLSYKEIAATLGVAHSTVRVQVAAIRKKLGDAKVPVLRRRA